MIILATFAKPLSRLLAFGFQAPTAPLQSPATSGPAMGAETWQRPAGEALLSVRAYRLHNRNARAAAVYLRKHAILSRGASCDAPRGKS